MPPSLARNRLAADIRAARQETIPFVPRIGKGDVQGKRAFLLINMVDILRIVRQATQLLYCCSYIACWLASLGTRIMTG